MAKIALRGVRKAFGSLTVLHGIDLEIAHGEFVVLVGPSGCGKSTLLRIVAGLETRTAGDIVIGDRVVNDVEPKDRDIAMVFQNYALYPHMSVYDNLAYGLRIRGMRKDEIEARVQKAAATLQIGQLLERKPRQLSGGQRQRVAMGRAIVRDPAAFLFDEPLSNLDAKLRVQMRVEIKRLQQRLGVTALYVTHDQVEAMTMADRLVVMNAGQAEQVGTPIDVYARPATQYVAGFIGSPAMNFVEARIAEDGRRAVLGDGAAVALDHGRPPGTAVIVGMRPEHLRRDGGAGALALKVDLVELLGADLLAYGELDGGARLVARLPGEAGIRAGDTLPLRIAPEAIHLFDPQGGARL